ncbi:uncharacterized protein LOC101851575 [Aplysia californica]|uniref:Uncharacterized protein LOC101851575 n=1 Tax=Aplysia californica TaxID=6500 RepID=A0ABM0JMS0_APLCA|nr:uncharacterized protein LOC101851575 [Aplysia californica]
MAVTNSSSLEMSTPDFNRTPSFSDLQAVNDDIARTLIPAMAFFGILMVIGIVGNSLVCYVFCRRLQPGTQNYLIVFLAVFDLLSCTIAMPNEIADMRYFYVFDSEPACKIMRFINSFCAMGSIMTLLAIAVDRYQKICKPFKRQLRVHHVKRLLIPILGLALFFAWPALIMYGLRTTDSGIPGIPGSDCSTPDSVKDTIYPLVYNGILFLAFIVLTTTLISLYCCVLWETKRHNRYMKRNSDFNLPSYLNSQTDDSSSSAEPPHAATFSPSTAISTEELRNATKKDVDVVVSDSTIEASRPQEITPGSTSGECPSTEPVCLSTTRRTVISDLPAETTDSPEESPPHASLRSSLKDADKMLKTKKKLSFCDDVTYKEIQDGFPVVRKTSTETIRTNASATSFPEEDPDLVLAEQAPNLPNAVIDLDSPKMEGFAPVAFSTSESRFAFFNVVCEEEEKEKEKDAEEARQKKEDSPSRPNEMCLQDTKQMSDRNQMTQSAPSPIETKTGLLDRSVSVISSNITPSHSFSKKKKRKVRSKTTVIAFLVTLVFILSFLPHLCLQVAKMIKKGFDYDLEGAALVFYNTFLRSYFINSVSNPIIYGLLNMKFRAEVKRLASSMKQCVTRRRKDNTCCRRKERGTKDQDK